MNLMEKQGKVKNIKGKKATVLLSRFSACGECNECIVSGRDRVEIEADNPISASKEDIVRVSIEEINLFFVTIIVYLIPLLLFLLGVYTGYQIFPFLFNILKYRSIFSVFSGILFLLIGSIVVLRKFNKKKKCNFRIIEKVSDN